MARSSLWAREADAKAQGYLDAAKVNKIVDLRGKTMLPGFVDGTAIFPARAKSTCSTLT